MSQVALEFIGEEGKLIGVDLQHILPLKGAQFIQGDLREAEIRSQLEELAPKAAKWGYEGLELACWGDHLNVDLAAKDMNYVKTHLKMLKSYGLNVFSISNHLAGQLVCDPNDDSR